jgi:hypothetical protein
MPPDIMNEQNMTPNVSIESVRQILFEDHHVVGRPVLEGLMALPSSDVGELLVLANEVRERFYGNRTAVEVLYNAKRAVARKIAVLFSGRPVRERCRTRDLK